MWNFRVAWRWWNAILLFWNLMNMLRKTIWFVLNDVVCLLCEHHHECLAVCLLVFEWLFWSWIMNMPCCLKPDTMPRILPWLCLFCCWLMLYDNDVAWPCLFLDAEYMLFMLMIDCWMLEIPWSCHAVVLNPKGLCMKTQNLNWIGRVYCSIGEDQ